MMRQSLLFRINHLAWRISSRPRSAQGRYFKVETVPNGPKSKGNERWFRSLGHLGLATFAATALSMQDNSVAPPAPAQIDELSGSHNISWNTFCYKLLAKGEVQRVMVTPGTNVVTVVVHPNAIVDGRILQSRIFRLQVPSLENFENKLRDFENSLGIMPGDGIPIVYERNNIGPIVSIALTLGIIWLLTRNLSMSRGTNFVSSMTRAKFTLVDPTSRAADSKSIRFSDVAGLHEAKIEIKEFVDYLKNAEKFMQLGAKIPKGVLLTGPPGCGKTLLAKAVATEANVPFLAMAGSDFVEMIGGLGASRVRSLFKTARKLSPCIIYIDEIDSIGRKRATSASFGGGESEQTLNQLLVEMDGMVARKNVILLASTNRADILDQALTRPGRFDRQILIDLPNLKERVEIFQKHASNIKLDQPPEQIALRMAQLTPGMSGADLANICNEAALQAARKDRTFVTFDDLEYAVERVIGGAEKRSSVMSAEERRMIAYHESGHALVGWLLKHTDTVLKISIVPRTSSILGFAQYTPSDLKLRSPDELFETMCVALGGRVAELIIFNHLSTGAQDDLKKVTDIAMAQITQYGFDPIVGHIVLPQPTGEFFEKRPYSKRLASVIDHRASLLVTSAFEATMKLLRDNVDKLNLIAQQLLEKEVLHTKDIEKLIGPRAYPKESTYSSSQN